MTTQTQTQTIDRVQCSLATKIYEQFTYIYLQHTYSIIFRGNIEYLPAVRACKTAAIFIFCFRAPLQPNYTSACTHKCE